MRFQTLRFALLFLTACARAPNSPEPRTAPLTEAQSTDRVSAPHMPVARAEEVSLAFDRDIWHFEGTLTIPSRPLGKRVPVVVLVHGSGPMSRDGAMSGQLGLGFGFDFPVYRMLAEALGEHGYAVYRYDKRTCGQFNGCSDKGFTSIPFDMIASAFATKEYVGDALAAMDAVRRFDGIDAERTYFIGHSEGGELVPLLLAERPAVRAGVMLAAPFHTMTVVLEQQGERLRWAHATSGDERRAEKESAELIGAARALAAIENGTYLGGLILGQPPGLWASWLDIAKKAPLVARELQQPLLVLGGGYDYNVATSEINQWEQWLLQAKHGQHRVKILPCVTHALNCITQPDPTRVQDADIGRQIHGELIGEIVAFLRANQQ
jgi:pimeloyl-ACP methyl ester carboxylesterase